MKKMLQVHGGEGWGRMMIRYRFDTVDQLSRHLRVVDHAVLLFVRGSNHPARGTKVLLEIQVKANSGRTVVRSEVVARADGAVPGTWLQLSESRLVQRLRERDALVGRHDPRRCVEQPVLLTAPGGTAQLGQMLDVSSGGLRVKGGGLRVGEEVQVQLMGARRSGSALGGARVERVDRSGAGLKFAQKTPDLKAYLHGLDEAWSKAQQIEHLPGCCAGGSLLDPVPPRIARRA